MNSLVIKKLIRPQPGKVSTQVRHISFTTPKLMALTLLTAPTPIMAVVLAWVVDTGRLSSEHSSKDEDAARSAEKPWYFYSFTISIPTDLMIFLPPMSVPAHIITAHSTIIQVSGSIFLGMD